MKLAFSLFKFFPYGGLQRDFLRIAAICQQRGHEVYVYTLEWQGDIPAGMHVTVVNKRGFTNHARYGHLAKVVAEEAKTKKFDTVVGFNKTPGLDIYFAADPCYIAKTEKCKSFLYSITPRHKFFAEAEKAVFDSDSHTKILVLTEKSKEPFIQYYGTPDERFHILPPGLAKERLYPSNGVEIRKQLRQEFSIEPHQTLLLMLGSGFKTKGVDRSLKALLSLPERLRQNVRLMIIGQDNAKPFQRMANKFGLTERVQFLPGRDDAQRFLLGADVLLHPAYNEAGGIVLLEALAVGLPVITTDVCGYAPHVEASGGGVVVNSPFDQIRFNIILQAFISNDRTEWHEKGLQYVNSTDLCSLHEKAADIILDYAAASPRA